MRVVLALLVVLLVVSSLSLASPVEAHPGRTDSSGGHTCRTNCARWGLSTGQYHRHGGSSTPAPTSPDSPARSEPDPATAIPANGLHTVQAGETLIRIAARYGISSALLLRWNPDLRLNSTLAAGETVVVAEWAVPEPEPAAPRAASDVTYAVEAGDSLYRIADRHDLTIEELLDLNQGLTLESVIHSGDELIVAEAVEEEIVEEPEPSAPEPAPETIEELEPVEPVETSTRETPAPEPTTPPQQTVASDADDGGGSGGWIAGIIVAIVASAGATWLFLRRRSPAE